MEEAYNKLKSDCEGSVAHFKQELGKIRTGRASTALIENLNVDYYGSSTPLNQLGMISAPEPRLLTVQVYDVGAMDAIEKAIQNAGLGLNPARDGNLVRIPVPSLTEERRKEFVKLLNKDGEEIKVGIRNHRRSANDTIKKAKDAKEITEDDTKRASDEIQKITDSFIKLIDNMVAEKEKEIMTV